MNIVNRLFAMLARIHFVIYLLLGMALMQVAINEIGFYSSLEALKNSLWGIALCWLSVNWACSKFYAEKYSIYTKNLGPLIAAIPLSDPYFYLTMASGIGNSRRIAGYLYVIDKIVIFLAIGSAFALGLNKI